MMREKGLEAGVDGRTLESVRDILRTVTKTIKTFNAYPKDNPVYQKFADALFEKFKTFFESEDDIELDVELHSLRYKGAEVFRSEDQAENIATLLFADGIRQLTFNKGITLDEIIDFIDVVRLAPRESSHDDTVTLLWEKNIKNLEYTVAEEAVEDLAVAGGAEDAATLHGAAYSTLTIKPVSLDIGTEPLTADELEEIKTEVLALDDRSLLSSAVNLFFELLSGERDMEAFSEMVRNLGRIVDIRMHDKDVVGAIEILRMLKKISVVSGVPEQHKIIEGVFDKAGGRENLKRLFAAGSDGAEISRYLSLLEKASVPNIIEILGELEDRKMRRLLCSILTELGRQDIGVFSEAINDGRWYVVRNIAMILGMMKEPAAINLIGKALGHPELRVRKEAIRSLEGIPSGETKNLFLSAIKDEDAGIRVSALRALRRFRGPELFSVLKEGASLDALKKKSFTEKKELLETLAAVGGEEAFPLLSELFKKRGLIEKDMVTEIRACAASGLGVIGTPQAVSLLQKETGSRKSLLREACQKAIKEATYGGNSQRKNP